MKLIDAHCHLQDPRLAPDLEGVFSRSVAVGVDRWVCCGTRQEDWPQVQALARQHPSLVPAYGLHPWYVPHRTPSWLDELTGYLDADPHAVVGEIGLDHALKARCDAQQLEAFERQLHLAESRSRPAVVHCRRAWGALLDVFRQCSALPGGFMVHSFSGSSDVVAELASRGAYFSFSGSVTFSGNKRARRSLSVVPHDRLLIETDAPDIPPMLHGEPPTPGTLNEPANLLMVAKTVATCLNVSVEEVGEQTLKNAQRLLGGVTA